ncbi:hypothetical protein C8Q74DRAFT_1304612 [Fomes fomentarius]|nr:hypothetical protein C8Q74DRAFT_1304612 [Fomes fomentarius]
MARDFSETVRLERRLLVKRDLLYGRRDCWMKDASCDHYAGRLRVNRAWLRREV